MADGGYHSVNPFVFARDPEGLMGFLADVLGGRETERLTRPDGSIGHAEMVVGDSVIMISTASAEFAARPAAFFVFVPDVDATFERAGRAGATVLREPTDQFYGVREAGVTDAEGNIWWIATPTEDVEADEVQRRWEQVSPTT